MTESSNNLQAVINNFIEIFRIVEMALATGSSELLGGLQVYIYNFVYYYYAVI